MDKRKKTDFAREWALKWAEGCIIGYIRGTLDEKRAIPMLKRAIEMLSPKDIMAIMESIKTNPVYLPSLNKEIKARRLKQLKEVLGL